MFDFLYVPRRPALIAVFVFLIGSVLGAIGILVTGILFKNSPPSSFFKGLFLFTYLCLASLLLTMAGTTFVENFLRRRSGRNKFLGMSRIGPWSNENYVFSQILAVGYLAAAVWMYSRFF